MKSWPNKENQQKYKIKINRGEVKVIVNKKDSEIRKFKKNNAWCMQGNTIWK